MKPAYRTVTRRGEGLHVVQRSKFLGVCVPVRGEDEAARAIEAERKKHYDARHHCYAFVLGQSLKRSSDDGEPSGTAGMPILEVLLRQNVRDALIVVTRYFGGVLLGTGGLVRAYSAAAKLALQDAGLADMYEAAEYRLEMDYAQYNRLQALLREAGAAVLQEDFAAGVTADVAVPAHAEEALKKRFIEITEGRGRLTRTGRGFRAFAHEDGE